MTLSTSDCYALKETCGVLKINEVREATADLKARVATLEADNKSLRTKVADSVADWTARVAVLEEARNTVDARVRAVIAETIAEMRVQFIQAQQIQLPPPETPIKQKRRKK